MAAGRVRFHRGSLPVKPAYAARWKASIWPIQIISGFHLGQMWATIPFHSTAIQDLPREHSRTDFSLAFASANVDQSPRRAGDQRTRNDRTDYAPGPESTRSSDRQGRDGHVRALLPPTRRVARQPPMEGTHAPSFVIRPMIARCDKLLIRIPRAACLRVVRRRPSAARRSVAEPVRGARAGGRQR
jgi:hypothetical protein